nr:bcl-2 homologous antagonist/killer [Zonotrichia albicollis]
MASGNEGNEERRGSHGLSSEGCVAEEAEEVFRSYAFYRYQQERQERGAELPPDPEIEQIQQDLESTGSQVGQRLAIIGDDIYRRYDPEFRTMLESLQPTRHNAYETFTNIASRTDPPVSPPWQEAVQNLDNVYVKYLLVVAVVVVLGHLVLRRFFTS